MEDDFTKDPDEFFVYSALVEAHAYEQSVR